MHKNKKETNKADFIDLEKSDFKKKSNSLKSILVVLVISTGLFFFMTQYKVSFERIQDSQDILMKNNEDKDEKPAGSENITQGLERSLEDDQITTKIFVEDEPSKIFESQDVYRVQELENIESEILAIKEVVEKKLTDQINNEALKKIDSILDKNTKFYNFLFFKNKLFNGDNYDKEIKILEKEFYQNVKISSHLKFFRELGKKEFLDYNYLYKSLNFIVNRHELKKEDIKFLKRDENLEIFSSKENFKKYFLNIFNSNFKIRKVEEQQNLNSYSDLNMDGVHDFVSILKEARELILIKDIELSLEKINEITSPIPYELEDWIINANLVMEMEERFALLESLLFDWMLNDKNT